MSFLTPLYALGILAVGLPVLVHLIQRRPKGQKDFSSTMFLKASPPRLTKRSRLENWPLLLLRTAAIVLLALAFARPFMRSSTQLEAEPPGRRVLVLMDTSASMQREDLWQQATEQLGSLLNDINPADQIALAAFDVKLQVLAPFEQTSVERSVNRAATIRAALSDVSPSWAATNLGSALVAAADLLHVAAEDRDKKLISGGGDTQDVAARRSEIILISDMQSGSHLEQLNGYQWPDDVRLSLRTVSPEQKGNATLTLLAGGGGALMESKGGDRQGGVEQLRLRVRNDAESLSQHFRVAWARSEEEDLTRDSPQPREVSTQVPPGESRVVRVDRGRGDRLTLFGDDQPFDNTAYVVERQLLSKQLWYVGDRDDAPDTGLSYYLSRATVDTARSQVEFEQKQPSAFLVAPKPLDVPLIVLGPLTMDRLAGEVAAILRTYLDAGGQVLAVTSKPSVAQRDVLAELMTLNDLVIGDATIDDYAMLSTIDFQHPLFQPFADPRFNDFTKIRFWSHRIIETANLETADRKILARFDDRSPALIEQAIGGGRLWVLAAGWQSVESQLALSTKFVPLIYGMLDPMRGQMATRASYPVGQPIASFAASSPGGKRQVLFPDGSVSDLSLGEMPTFETPGIYTLVDGDVRTPFAVNVSPSEGETSPFDASELERYGVQTAGASGDAQSAMTGRQMRDVELEGGQKLWRWLILAALAVLAIETLLGGWFANRQSAKPLPA